MTISSRLPLPSGSWPGHHTVLPSDGPDTFSWDRVQMEMSRVLWAVCFLSLFVKALNGVSGRQSEPRALRPLGEAGSAGTWRVTRCPGRRQRLFRPLLPRAAVSVLVSLCGTLGVLAVGASLRWVLTDPLCVRHVRHTDVLLLWQITSQVATAHKRAGSSKGQESRTGLLGSSLGVAGLTPSRGSGENLF